MHFHLISLTNSRGSRVAGPKSRSRVQSRGRGSNRELTNRWLPRGRRRLNTRSSLCACATGCGIISRVVLKEATTSEERFWSRLPSNASKGTFCSEYLLNLTLNPQIPSKYANRSFPETSFYFTECYSRHSSYLSNRKDVNLRKEWPKPFKRTVRE